MPRLTLLVGFFLPFLVPHSACALSPETGKEGGEVANLIAWLLEEKRDLDGIPFSKVVAATAGKAVVPVDLTNGNDRRIIEAISRVANEVLAEINQPNHPVHQVDRINEVSGHIENLMLEKLQAVEGFVCTYPKTADGRFQRSGYPDLQLLDRASGRVFYIDPKLYAIGSEGSSFRTFYFEPKVETNKILEDASHLILGISNNGRVEHRWKFVRWKLADLSTFEVRLKAEFQGSNRDLYRREAIIAESGPDEF